MSADSDLHHHREEEISHLQSGTSPGVEHREREENIPGQNDDFALENAIGDAFMQLAMLGQENSHGITAKESKYNAESGENHNINDPEPQGDLAADSGDDGKDSGPSDMDLEHAVGDLFTSLSHEEPSESKRRSGNSGDEASGTANSDAISHLPDAGNSGIAQILEENVSRNEPEQGERHDYQTGVASKSLLSSLEGQRAAGPQENISSSHPENNSKEELHGSLELPHSPHNAHAHGSPGKHSDNASREGSPMTSMSGNVHHDNSDDDDLENAIGDAFKNLVGGGADDHESLPHSERQSGGEDFDDANLEDAIGAAFKSLTGEYTEKEHSNVEDAAASSKSHAGEPGSGSAPNEDIDIGSIVNSAVQQIGGQPGSDSRIPKDSHNSTEYSSQIHTEPSGHIQEHSSSGHNPPDHSAQDPQDLDAALKAAVADAVKSAFPAGNTKLTNPEVDAEKESDLDQLQMNEILQNAFNMAMQNPQELLALDAEETPEKAHSPEDHVLASATAIAAMSVKKALDNKESGISKTGPEKTANKKPLSIAETLALHRSNMSTAQRDYSSINSLEVSGPSSFRGFQPTSQNHPQLSTILSSLSQHIQSGTHSSNLMQVIRQMTNALMLTKKLPANFSKAGQDMVKEVRNSGDKGVFVASLHKTKHYILGMLGDENRVRASALIENILETIDPKQRSSVSYEEASSEHPGKTESDLPQLYDAAFSTLTTIDMARLRMAIAGVKPEVDSTEHKSRIREGNRERKKKWREGNAERNKDNDLRCRVLKRAALKFGEGSSDEKSEWIEREYTKRRNRRLSRQKKEDAKMDSSSEDSPAQDPLLVKRVTDAFDLITECGYDEDPRAVLLAVCAMSAVVASSCAEVLHLHDTSVLGAALSSILGSIFEGSLRSGTYRKFMFLVKREDEPAEPGPELTREELLRKFSALNAQNSSGMSALDALRQSQKRLGLDIVDSSYKRIKTDRTDDYSDSADFADSSSSSISSWTTASSLKMPSYRKPSGLSTVTDPELFKVDLSRREYVEPIPKIASPFISNKIGTEASTVPLASGFKKPGNLQRPGFSKPSSKASSLGFPTLYSASFRSN